MVTANPLDSRRHTTRVRGDSKRSRAAGQDSRAYTDLRPRRHDCSSTMSPANSSGGGDSPHPENKDHQLGDLLAEFRPRLRRMVTLRLDPRLSARVDASDVVQEAYVEVSRRMQAYQASEMPFFLWVRQITNQKLIDLHRKHMGAVRRDVRREVRLSGPGLSSSISLARALARDSSSPSGRAIRAERLDRLRQALENMKEIDREILLLRHFEDLTFPECGLVLGITTGAAKVRHLRAAGRLGEVLRQHGGEDELMLPAT